MHHHIRIAAGLAAVGAALPLVAATATAAGPTTTTLQGSVVHRRGPAAYVIAAPNGALAAVHGVAPAVGRRVRVRAVALRDGTFAARAVRDTGRSRATPVQGVVTYADPARRRFTVSAPGVSLAVRGTAPALGAHVRVAAGVPGPRGVHARSVRTLAGAPRAASVPLTGTVVRRPVRGSLVLTADDGGGAAAGRLRLAVPAGLALGPLRAGTPVTATATLRGSALTLEALSTDTAAGAASAADDRGRPHAAALTLCHATPSGSVQVTLAPGAVAGHAGHAGDIVPAPATGCPAGSGSTPSGGVLARPAGARAGFGDAAAVCAAAGLPAAAAAKIDFPSGFDAGGSAVLGGALAGTVTVSGADDDTVAFALADGAAPVAGVVVHAGAGQEVAIYEYAPAVAADTGLHGPARAGKVNPYATISFVVLCAGPGAAAPSPMPDPSPAPQPAPGPAPAPAPGPPAAPAAGPAPDGPLLSVGKVEAQVDLAPLQTRTVDLACPAGALMTDGRPRVDAVDQGMGTLASVQLLQAAATGPGSFRFRLRNAALGAAQTKVFGVCLAGAPGEPAPAAGEEVTAPARLLGPGDHVIALTCPAGTIPVAPGFSMTDGGATLHRSAPAVGGWELGLRVPVAAVVDASLRCLPAAVGSGHRLQTHAVTRDLDVTPGAPVAGSIVCGEQEKGIVAGFGVPPGVLWLGDDPEPKTRVFRLLNLGDAAATATASLVCLGDRAAPA